MELPKAAVLVMMALCLCPNAYSKLDFPDSITSADNIDNLVQYEYKYQVDEGLRSGPVMDRWERRLGDHVKGAYSVQQPDGRIQTVDYEVDGDKGYRAITRFSPPANDYLSYQQLSRSGDVFPNPAKSATEHEHNHVEVPPPPPPQTPDQIINYHSRPPYINKREFKDHKASASTNVATAVLRDSPRTPANYNVPLSKELIYYKAPAGQILASRQPQSSHNLFNIDALLPSQPNWRDFMYKQGITEVVTRRPEPFKSTPAKRHSRLVRRYQSMDDVYS